MNRTFYTYGDSWSYNEADMIDARNADIAAGYGAAGHVERFSEAEAYGADHDPAMFSNPERPKVRAPKVGRRYRLLRR